MDNSGSTTGFFKYMKLLKALWDAQSKLIIEINAGTDVKKGLFMAKFGLTKVLSQTFLVSVMW